jgi:hypothetical protein
MAVIMDNFQKKSPGTFHFHFFDPGRLFERIIRAWGAEKIHLLPLDPARTTELPVERKVILAGTLRGVLVLRTSAEFLYWLRGLRENTAMGRYNPEEIFEEMVSLYCLYLFHDFWNPDSFQIGPIHPLPSTPADWPPSAPHASCGMEVEGFPLEIRLWLTD